MLSDFDDMAADAADALQDVFGERTADGRLDEKAVTIRVRGKSDEHCNAKFGKVRTERVINEGIGSEVRAYRDTIEIDLYRSAPEMNAKLDLVGLGEPAWAIEEVVRSESYLSELRLKRERPYAKQKPGLDSRGR